MAVATAFTVALHVMYKEIPNWKCWVEERLVSRDVGTFCLKKLVGTLNSENSGDTSFQELELQIYARMASISDQSVRCQVGGCEARSEIDPLEILAGRDNTG